MSGRANEPKNDVVFSSDFTILDVYKVLTDAEELFEEENFRTQPADGNEKYMRLLDQYLAMKKDYEGFLQLTMNFIENYGPDDDDSAPLDTIVPLDIRDGSLSLEQAVAHCRTERWINDNSRY